MLDEKNISIDIAVDARKERIDSETAWQMLKPAKRIVTAKGRKVQGWNPQKDDKTMILKAAIGPSGNLRAPTLQIDNTFIIGFNIELYEKELG